MKTQHRQRQAERAARTEDYAAQVIAACAQLGRTPTITDTVRGAYLDPSMHDAAPEEIAAYLCDLDLKQKANRMRGAAYRMRLRAARAEATEPSDPWLLTAYRHLATARPAASEPDPWTIY